MHMEVGPVGKLSAALVALSVSLSVPASVAQVATPNKESSPRSVSPTSQDVLSALPADASAVLIIRDLAGLDAKLRRITEQLGLPFSPYMLAKGWLGIVTGIDDDGPAAIALVPTDVGAAGSPHDGAALGHGTQAQGGASLSHASGSGMVMLLPTANRDELLSFLGKNPRPHDDGYTRVTLRGHESCVATKGGFTVFASDPRAMQAVLQAKKSLADRFSKYQRKRAAVNDVALWIDLSSSSAPAIPGMGVPWLRSLIGSEGGPPKRLRGIQLSVRFETEGVALELYGERCVARRGMPARETTDTMLRGLPDEPFVLAMGMTGGAVTASARTMVDLLIPVLSAAGIIDPARSGELRLALELVMEGVEGAASSMSILPEGSDGRTASAKVVRTTGDGRLLTAEIEAFVRVLKRGLFVDPDVNLALEKLEYRRGVETSRGVTIDHLVLDLSDFEAVDHAALSKLVGHEGLLIRVGVVDVHHVVQTLGGGLDRFNSVVAAVRAGDAPLALDPGAMTSARGVAHKRSLEAYVAVGRVITLANAIAAVAGTPINQVGMAETNAPIALAMHSVGSNAAQIDVFVPAALVITVKNMMLGRIASEATFGGDGPS